MEVEGKLFINFTDKIAVYFIKVDNLLHIFEFKPIKLIIDVRTIDAHDLILIIRPNIYSLNLAL